MRHQYTPATILTSHRRTTEERFWEKVIKTHDCWYWTGCVNSSGYGMFWGSDWTGNKGLMKALEYSWWIHFGRKYHPETKLRPTCGNRLCVNPEHLGEFYDR
jgi:hypothetical protein